MNQAKHLHLRQWYAPIFLLTIMSFFIACGGGTEERVATTNNDKGSTTATTTTSASNASAGDIDAAADPSVSAELGGAGFDAIADSLGWTTGKPSSPVGDPKATKGGSISMAWPELPPTTRNTGKQSNFSQTSIIATLVYETLLGQDTKTQEFVPALATHWKISEDGKTYWYRIDPRAKWADGTPVSSKDIIASWELRVDKGIEEPFINSLYEEGFEKPVAESKYIVRVQLVKDSWRNGLYISASTTIYPAHYLEKLDGGKGFIDKYQWEMMLGSGPYEMNLEASSKGEQLVFKRRANYWGENLDRNKGLNNFDEIKFIAIADPKLQLEKFKKGDFDVYQVSRAQWWAEELTSDNIEEIKRGLIQKRKIYNISAAGMSGMALNTRESPFNDAKVRAAMQYLWNIPELSNKMFYDEYVQCRSYFEGTIFANPNNDIKTYNPDKAVQLLTEAGWTKKAGEKWLTKNGETFELDLNIVQSLERILTPLQQDLEKVGIKLNLVQTTAQARFKKAREHQFKMTLQNWGGLNIPNPENTVRSKFADEKPSNNLPGVKDPRIDELCDQYDKSKTTEERLKILQEIDKRLVEGNYYVMSWIAPYNFRCAYWNKFNMPAWGLPHTTSYRYEYVFNTWWVDQDKAKKLAQAESDPSIILPTEDVEVDYWGRKK